MIADGTRLQLVLRININTNAQRRSFSTGSLHTPVKPWQSACQKCPALGQKELPQLALLPILVPWEWGALTQMHLEWQQPDMPKAQVWGLHVLWTCSAMWSIWNVALLLICEKWRRANPQLLSGVTGISVTPPDLEVIYSSCRDHLPPCS